jgi:hypothetical protein
VQLATVSAAGRPSVRTVAFRGFLLADQLGDGGGGADQDSLRTESSLLLFVTDSRAAKIRDVRANGFVEVCWWLDEAAVQFRIAGRALVAGPDSPDPHLAAVCRSVWSRLKASTKETFTWPTPGLPRDGREPVGPEAESALEPSDSDDDSDPLAAELQLDKAFFNVLIVIPECVDELKLGGRQRRRIYTLQHEAGEPHTEFESAVAAPFVDLFWYMQAAVWTVQEVNP